MILSNAEIEMRFEKAQASDHVRGLNNTEVA